MHRQCVCARALRHNPTQNNEGPCQPSSPRKSPPVPLQTKPIRRQKKYHASTMSHTSARCSMQGMHAHAMQSDPSRVYALQDHHKLSRSSCRCSAPTSCQNLRRHGGPTDSPKYNEDHAACAAKAGATQRYAAVRNRHSGLPRSHSAPHEDCPRTPHPTAPKRAQSTALASTSSTPPAQTLRPQMVRPQ